MIFFFPLHLLQTEKEKSIVHQKVRQSLTAPEHRCIVHGKFLSGASNSLLAMHFWIKQSHLETGLGGPSRCLQGVCVSHKENGITYPPVDVKHTSSLYDILCTHVVF